MGEDSCMLESGKEQQKQCFDLACRGYICMSVAFGSAFLYNYPFDMFGNLDWGKLGSTLRSINKSSVAPTPPPGKQAEPPVEKPLPPLDRDVMERFLGAVRNDGWYKVPASGGGANDTLFTSLDDDPLRYAEAASACNHETHVGFHKASRSRKKQISGVAYYLVPSAAEDSFPDLTACYEASFYGEHADRNNWATKEGGRRREGSSNFVCDSSAGKRPRRQKMPSRKAFVPKTNAHVPEVFERM